MAYLLRIDTMKKTLSILLCIQLSSLKSFAQLGEQWGYQGDGTYINPVLPGDYSDLDAIRVGDD
jgi:hypothetical protein